MSGELSDGREPAGKRGTSDGTGEDSHPETADSALLDLPGLLVPAGLAVVTWLVALLAAGYLLRLKSVTFFTVIPLVVIFALFWPIIAAAPWRPAVSARVVLWAKRNHETLFAVVLLTLVAVLPFTPDLLIRVIELPYRGSGIFFGASLFYRERLGATFAEVLLRFGQWYLELIWLYVLGSALATVVRWVQ